MKRWLVLFVCGAVLSAYLGKPLRLQMKIEEDLPLPPNAEFFERWGMGLGPPAAMAYWLKLLSVVGGWTAGEGMHEKSGASSLNRIDHFTDARSRKWLVAYLDGIITLAPNFPEPYLYAGVMLYWFFDAKNEAMSFLARGVDAKIAKWEIPYYLGFFHYRANHFEEAYKYYSIAAQHPDAPHVAPLMVSLAASRSGDAKAALTMLDSLLEHLPERMEGFRYLLEADREQQAKLVKLLDAAESYAKKTGRPLEHLLDLSKQGLVSADDLKPSTGAYLVKNGTVVFDPDVPSSDQK